MRCLYEIGRSASAIPALETMARPHNTSYCPRLRAILPVVAVRWRLRKLTHQNECLGRKMNGLKSFAATQRARRARSDFKNVATQASKKAAKEPLRAANQAGGPRPPIRHTDACRRVTPRVSRSVPRRNHHFGQGVPLGPAR